MENFMTVQGRPVQALANRLCKHLLLSVAVVGVAGNLFISSFPKFALIVVDLQKEEKKKRQGVQEIMRLQYLSLSLSAIKDATKYGNDRGRAL